MRCQNCGKDLSLLANPWSGRGVAAACSFRCVSIAAHHKGTFVPTEAQKVLMCGPGFVQFHKGTFVPTEAHYDEARVVAELDHAEAMASPEMTDEQYDRHKRLCVVCQDYNNNNGGK